MRTTVFQSHLLKIISGTLITLFSLECYFHFQYDGNWLYFCHYFGTSFTTSKCTNDMFRVGHMTGCHKQLRCSEIVKDLVVTDQVLGEGAQKAVKKGLWQDQEVAVSFLKNQEYLEDFQHGLKMLQMFAEDPGYFENKVVQLVGWCFENTPPVIVTELHPLGAASGLHLLLREKFQERDSLLQRFVMCIEFVQILNILHSHYTGPRVLCDANYPQKALSQFLLSNNLSLILNDMDALPRVDRQSGQLVKCGHRELQGEYVAPEQRWNFDREFDDSAMPHYDEKIDIWKIPDVCNFIIGDTPGASKIQLHLFNIHSKCKQTEPSKRPTAHEVLMFYKNLYDKL